MKRGLVIGAAGFVGNYLINEMHSEGMECFATKLPNEKFDNPHAIVYDLDILDKESVANLLMEIRPDYIFHLAAQSSVGVAWKNPGLTIDVNIKGSVNVMDAIRELYYKPRVLLIGSGEEYGHIKEGDTPIAEDTLLRPGNIYAATKACQNMIGSIYSKAYDMDLIMVRAFNHIGPGQLPLFVVSDFCKQTAEIELGLREPVISVGNLDAMRDFTDVRDVVRAYVLLVQKGNPGETYNVGRGEAVRIRTVLDKIIEISGADISVEIDQAKLRPVDVPIIEADITKIHSVTGWEPVISIEQTIKETLDYWRVKLKEDK